MKKILTLLLALSLLLFVFAFSFAEEEQPKVFTSGDWEYTVMEDGTISIKEYFGKDTELSVPEELEGKKVTGIEDQAFNSFSLKRIEIPESITSIETNPFSSCNELMDIRVSMDHQYFAVIDGVLFSKPDKRLICYPRAFSTTEYSIPQGIQIIGDNAFAGCSSLRSIVIPDSVTSIGVRAFSGCSSLENVVMPEGISRIEDAAFQNCTSLKDIHLPDSVNDIGQNPFFCCDHLTDISISPDHSIFAVIDGVLFNKINKTLISFPRYKNLMSYEIPQGIREIGDTAFAGCKYLKRILIPDSVQRIGINPFAFSESITEIVVSPEHPYFEVVDNVLISKADKTLICYPRSKEGKEYGIPHGIMIIGDYAFSSCGSLTGITIPDSVMIIGDHAFSSCESLKEITIPDSVMSIGDFAFVVCSSLTDVTLSNNLKEIGNWAFSLCSCLTNISIPEGVISIGEWAFSGNKSLVNVSIPKSVMRIGKKAFNNCKSLTVIVERDSYAKQYCEEYGLKYTYPDANSWLTD